MWNRRRRAAINQSEIRKRCKGYDAICEGYRSFGMGIPRLDCPHYKDKEQGFAWLRGWDLARDKQWEKENDGTGKTA